MKTASLRMPVSTEHGRWRSPRLFGEVARGAELARARRTLKRALAIAIVVGCAAEARDSLAAPCGTIGYAGAVIDDGDACFEPGGPAASLRDVRDAGLDGDLVWTHTTDDTAEANYGQWHLDFEQAGRYRVEVYTDTAYAQSKQATYVVQHGAASDEVIVDQTAVDGWQTLGELDFEAGGEQWVHLADNTGEPLADNVQLVFDAVRVTRVETDDTGSGSGSDDDEPPADGGGCAVGGHLGLALVGLVGGLRRRRRRGA